MDTKEVKTYRLIIKGKVQDVGFRHWFSNLAISLGLSGYVQNQNNRDEVEAIIQGDMENILNIAEKSKTGPELALVEGVIPNKIITNATYSGFIVKYDNK
jgi:acylphosphatase